MKKIFLWTLQLTIAAILGYASFAKLTSQPDSIYIFSELGMEPIGRFIIGVVELSATLFLLTKRLAATGALLAMGIMFGAIIAHASILGTNVLGDEGTHILMLALVLVSSVIVAYLRRRHLPFIGQTFRKESGLP